MKKKWFFIIGITLLLGGGFWYWRHKTAQPNVATVAVSRGDIKDIVSVSASLVASEDIDLNFEITGRIKSVSTREGQKVGAGDVIATLESVSLDEGVANAQAALDRARADASANDDALREANSSVKDAKAYYDAVGDAEDQKVSAADAAYDNARDYESDAETYYNQVVLDSGASSATAKSAKLSLTMATNARKAADEARDTAQKNRDSTVQYAKNTWDAAKEKVKTLESSAQKTIETSAIASAEASYQIALANAEKAKIKAPVNGEVVKLNYQAGEVVGTSVAGSFGKLLSYDALLEAKVPESDIVKVKVGQKADISFDSFDSNDIVPAEVVEIEPDSTVIQDVVYYIVKLRLVSIDARLKPGMSGDADIKIDEKQNVLEIPSRILREDGAKYFAKVLLSNGSVEEREVTIGLRGNDGLVEVLSGLSEGDAVISETK